MSKIRNLEYISKKSLPIGQVVGIASNLANFPGSEYVGDFIWVGAYSQISDNIARRVENFGERTGKGFIKKFGEYFNEITIPLVTTYFALGETLIDWIPFTVMDEKDVYAGLIGGALGFMAARGMKRERKSKNSGL